MTAGSAGTVHEPGTDDPHRITPLQEKNAKLVPRKMCGVIPRHGRRASRPASRGPQANPGKGACRPLCIPLPVRFLGITSGHV